MAVVCVLQGLQCAEAADTRVAARELGAAAAGHPGLSAAAWQTKTRYQLWKEKQIKDLVSDQRKANAARRDVKFNPAIWQPRGKTGTNRGMTS